MKHPKAMLILVVGFAVLALGAFLFASHSTPLPVITLTHLGSTNVGEKSLVLFSVRNTNAFAVGYGMAIYSPPSAARPQPFWVRELTWRGQADWRPWQGVASNSTARFAIDRPVLPEHWQLKLFCRPEFRGERFKDKVSVRLRSWGLGPLTRLLVDDPVVVASPEFDPTPAL